MFPYPIMRFYVPAGLDDGHCRQPIIRKPQPIIRQRGGPEQSVSVRERPDEGKADEGEYFDPEQIDWDRALGGRPSDIAERYQLRGWFIARVNDLRVWLMSPLRIRGDAADSALAWLVLAGYELSPWSLWKLPASLHLLIVLSTSAPTHGFDPPDEPPQILTRPPGGQTDLFIPLC